MTAFSSVSVLFVLLGLCPVVRGTSLRISFTYQSQSNGLGLFITMYTLCLAPLVTHIAFGLPKTVVLASKKPGFIDRVTDFNPISITWRYYAIAYRRLRAKQWKAADMAACNVHFWTGEGYDTSEEMIIQSRYYLTTPPESTHVALVSASTLSTVALLLQGTQALFLMGTSISLANSFSALPTYGSDLTSLFLPLAVLGVIRLVAAYWTTNDFGYSFDGAHLPSYVFTVEDALLDSWNWKCILYRAFWVITISILMGIGIADVSTAFISLDASVIIMSLTGFLDNLLYMQLTIGMLVIHVMYVLKNGHLSTIIPCGQSTWYKIFTFLLMATALAGLIAGSLETIQLPNGVYVSTPLLNCTATGVCSQYNKTEVAEFGASEWIAFFDSHNG